MAEIEGVNRLGGVVESTPAQSFGTQDTFLKLLTTQMQNQDPTNPMKNEDFVAQLAQFSSLEQQMGMQSTLEAIYLGIASMNNATMASLVGKDVVAVGDQVALDGHDVELAWDAEGAASETTIQVYDDNGNLVASIDAGARAAGEHTITWDGRGSDGKKLPDGTYTFQVVAKSGDTEVATEERVVGNVEEMDYSSGTPQLLVDGVGVSIGDVLKLRTAS